MRNNLLIILCLFLSPLVKAQGASEDNNGDIGLSLTKQWGLAIAVESVAANSPAERAGIKAGDWLDEVDGVWCALKELEEVMELLRGEAGTMVEIKVSRGDDKLTFNVKREAPGGSDNEPDPFNFEDFSFTDDKGDNFCAQFDKLLNSAIHEWSGVKGERVEGGIFHTYYKCDFDLPGFTDLRIDGTGKAFTATYDISADSTAGKAKYRELIDKLGECKLSCEYVGGQTEDWEFRRNYAFIPFKLMPGAEPDLMQTRFRIVYIKSPGTGKTTVSISVWKE